MEYKQSTIALVLTVILGFGALLAFSPLRTGGATQGQQGYVPVCSVPDVLKTVGGPWSRPTAVTPNFRQSFSFAGGGSTVQITRHERANSSSAWDSQTLRYTTDLNLTDVGFCSGGAVLYVAGIRITATGCEDVIEEWEMNLQDGAYTLACSTPPQPRGSPMLMPYRGQIQEQIVGGGGYVPVAQRRVPQPPLTKTVIYSGTIGTISAIEVDPEGRFLLVQSHQSGDLYSLDLAATGPPMLVLEFSAAQYPQLANTQNLVAYDHATMGRIYAAKEGSKHIGLVPSGAKYTYLRDADNDGLFEDIEVLDVGAYMASPYFDNSQYVSLVNTGVTVP